MPGMRCAVAVCNNNFNDAKKKQLNISFHSFPKNKELRKLWIEKCGRSDLFNPNTSSVCSDHFRKEDYELSFQAELIGIPKRKYLIKTAFPLINLGSSLTENESSACSITSEIFHIQEREEIIGEVICKPELVESTVEISSETLPQNNVSIKEFQCAESLEIKYHKLLVQHKSLKRKYENILESHKSLESESKQLRSKVRKISEQLKIEQESQQLLKNVLNTSFSTAQIQVLTNTKKRVHWSDEDISKAFVIRRLSKRCYLYLRNTLKYPLPHEDTFKKKGMKINS